MKHANYGEKCVLRSRCPTPFPFGPLITRHGPSIIITPHLFVLLFSAPHLHCYTSDEILLYTHHTYAYILILFPDAIPESAVFTLRSILAYFILIIS